MQPTYQRVAPSWATEAEVHWGYCSTVKISLRADALVPDEDHERPMVTRFGIFIRSATFGEPRLELSIKRPFKFTFHTQQVFRRSI